MLLTDGKHSGLGLLAIAGGVLLTATLANASACPRGITSPFTATEDVVETSSSTSCITVNAGITVNLAGFSIVCNASGGCQDGITIASTAGVIVKNGYIKKGSQSWYRGIYDNTGTPNSTITKMTFDGMQYGVVNPGSVLQTSVFKNISNTCILAQIGLQNSADITQNYCNSGDWGIVATGAPLSGTAPKIERNYVRGDTDSGIDTSATSGLVTVLHNIVDGGSPLINAGSGTTLTGNLCNDATDCPDPDSNFGLTLTFTP